MILYHGDIKKLVGKNWCMLELRSERANESTIKRIGKALPSIFQSEPVEIYIPVNLRDMDIFELKTCSYIFIRALNLKTIQRLKTITGVVGCVVESNHVTRVISIDNAYVQDLIAVSEKEFQERVTGIQIGSFVRIMDGKIRDYCGTVQNLVDGIACVQINLKTKSIMVETPMRNLVDMSTVPEAERVFYHCSLLTELDILGQEGSDLIKEDLIFSHEVEVEDPRLLEMDTHKVKTHKHSRQKTVTALVKKLVYDQVIDPHEISRKVIEALVNKDIKPPKNLFIVYCIIKNTLMNLHFRKQNPELCSYRDVIRTYGKQYRFSASDIAKLDTELGIPVKTLEVCQDGRSRSARNQRKVKETAD